MNANGRMPGVLWCIVAVALLLRLLGRFEQIVAPLDRAAQRALPLGQIFKRTAQKLQAILQSI